MFWLSSTTSKVGSMLAVMPERVTALFICTFTSTVSPAFRVLFCRPVALSMATLTMPGAVVSTCQRTVLLLSEPSLLALPAKSTNCPLATDTLAPAVLPALGVKVALRVRPLPLRLPKVPPTTVMLAALKLAPTSSLKVKVTVSLAPTLSAVWVALMLTRGTAVSTKALLCAVRAAWLRLAVLPLRSWMRAELSSVMLLAAMLTPSSSLSPLCSV